MLAALITSRQTGERANYERQLGMNKLTIIAFMIIYDSITINYNLQTL